MEKKKITPNIASFVGATTVRNRVIGMNNLTPTSTEMKEMELIVCQAMEDGAMGLGNSLIYPPAEYAKTEELIALAKQVSKYGGMYITHMRSESDQIIEALDETIRIAREAHVATEIYHLKVSQKWNWNKIDAVINRITKAQQDGLKITADMYPYSASSTTITTRLPTWTMDGGINELRKRIKNKKIRKKILTELKDQKKNRNSDPADVQVLHFDSEELTKLFVGKRLSEIAALRHTSADEVMLDLISEDTSNIPCIFYLIDEANMKRMLTLPFVSICSDGVTIPDEKPFNIGNTHPRVYGSFARFLGTYVRDQKLMSLEEAVYRMTGLPASNLKIKKRGLLKVGYFADVVVFDFNKIQDQATYKDSHQYAEGVLHVWVNGVQVLNDGNHTGAMPGRVVYGHGKVNTH